MRTPARKALPVRSAALDRIFGQIFGALLFLVLATSGRVLAQDLAQDVVAQDDTQEHEPMRFWLAKVAGVEGCGPDCPDVLIAEGMIEHTSVYRFAFALFQLKGRRVPIVLHSPGGLLLGAKELGEAIRRQGFSVLVGRWEPTCHDRRDIHCPPHAGEAFETVRLSGIGAFCASACPLVLAGGVARLALPDADIGVHEGATRPGLTTDVVRTLTPNSDEGMNRRSAVLAREILRDHFSAMGVDAAILDDYARAPASDMHWLTQERAEALALLTPRSTADGPLRALLAARPAANAPVPAAR